MRFIFIHFLIFFIGNPINAQSDSTYYPKNRIVLAVNIVSQNGDTYHTFGFERAFHIYKGLHLAGYGGIGYLPRNSKKLFTQYLGFNGSGFYPRSREIVSRGKPTYNFYIYV